MVSFLARVPDECLTTEPLREQIHLHILTRFKLEDAKPVKIHADWIDIYGESCVSHGTILFVATA